MTANLRDVDSISTGNSAATQITLTGNQINLRTGSTDRARADSTGLTVLNGNILVQRGGVSTPASVTLQADAGNNREVLFRTGTSTRWNITASNASESGSNAGSDLTIGRWTDGGTFVSNVVTLTRSTGAVTIAGSFAVDANGGTASSTHTIRANSSGYYVGLFPRLGDGAFNSLVSADDNAIIFTTGTTNTGSLVIGPWTNAAGGYGLKLQASGANTLRGLSLALTGGPVTVSDTTAATSTTTGALVVTGGAGVGGSLHVGATVVAANLSARGTIRMDVMGNVDTQGSITLGRTLDVGQREHLVTVRNSGTPANNWIAFNVHNGTIGAQTEVLRLLGDTSASFAGNVDVVGRLSVSVQTGVAAAGTTQGTATGLTSSVSVVATSTAGSATGVRLPASPVSGTIMWIINTSANTINVFPATGGFIDALAQNASFPLGSGGKLQFVATSTTQWYALTAVYA